jgi:phosphoglycerate dehydrogenase-like enzyme
MTRTERLTVLIASYLEPEHVATIRAADPRIEVLDAPDLLGRPTYRGDHYMVARRTPAEEARWLALLGRAEVLFDFDRTHLDDLPTCAPRLRWIQGTSAGIGRFVQRTGLDRSGLLLTTASGVHATALAEFCLMAMLMFVKDAFGLAEAKARRQWARHSRPELAGQTLAVVGLGQIGAEVARRARALGMRALGTKRTLPGADSAALGVERLYAWTDLQSLLAAADHVVLSCPHTPETEGLIGDRELRAMKPGGLLINVARGAVVDEPALVRALRSGHLGGAALDVFRQEPLPPESPFWDLPNVLISPHSASTADDENARLTALFVENLRRYLGGQPLRNLYDPVRGY